MEQCVKQVTKKLDESGILTSNSSSRPIESSMPPSIDAQVPSDGENINSTTASDREANTMTAPMREMLKELESKLDGNRLIKNGEKSHCDGSHSLKIPGEKPPIAPKPQLSKTSLASDDASTARTPPPVPQKPLGHRRQSKSLMEASSSLLQKSTSEHVSNNLLSSRPTSSVSNTSTSSSVMPTYCTKDDEEQQTPTEPNISANCLSRNNAFARPSSTFTVNDNSSESESINDEDKNIIEHILRSLPLDKSEREATCSRMHRIRTNSIRISRPENIMPGTMRSMSTRQNRYANSQPPGGDTMLSLFGNRSDSLCVNGTGRDNDSILSPEENRRRKMELAASELAVTEYEYKEKLTKFAVTLPLMFKQLPADRQARCIKGHAIVNEIAKTVEQFLEMHVLLSEELSKALNEDWNPFEPRIASIIIKYAHMLKLCRPFLQQVTRFTDEMIAARRRERFFDAMCTMFEAQYFNSKPKNCVPDSTSHLRIEQELNCVHQRITRYHLLLEPYRKYLDPLSNADEVERCDEALRLVDEVTRDLNSINPHEQDELNRVADWLKSEKFQVRERTRKLLKVGDVKKLSPRQRKGADSRKLILFNDRLLYCKPIPGTGLWSIQRIKDGIKLDDPNLNVVAETDTDDFRQYKFVLSCREFSVTLLTENSYVRDGWIKAINDAHTAFIQKGCMRKSTPSEQSNSMLKPVINLQRNSSESGCSRQSFRSMNDENDELPSSASKLFGRGAPNWINDKDVSQCQVCARKFDASFIARFGKSGKHHCRKCGKCICGNCFGEAPIDYLDWKQKKVCTECFETYREEVTTSGYFHNLGPERRVEIGLRFEAPKNRKPVKSNSEASATSDTLFQGNMEIYDESTQRWGKRYIKLFELHYNSQMIGQLQVFEARQDKTPLPSSILLLGFELLKDSEKHEDDYFYITLQHENQGLNATDGTGVVGGERTYLRLRTDTERIYERLIEQLPRVLPLTLA